MPDERRKQIYSERRLAFLYTATVIFSILSISISKFLFDHWHSFLNLCENSPPLDSTAELVNLLFHHTEKNCGCFLYAKTTEDFLFGSLNLNCDFIIYSQIPGIIIGTLLLFWHGYRLFYDFRSSVIKNNKLELETRNHFGKVGTVYKPKLLSLIGWLGCAFVLLILVLMSITSAILFWEGTRQSCDEFRQVVVDKTQAEGNLASYFEDGMGCTSVFDLMDYLRVSADSDVVNIGYLVNYMILLQWGAVLGWVLATVICVGEAFRYLKCCCYKGHVVCMYWAE